jgi:hypothetical protein
MADVFTLKNRAILFWLTGVFATSLTVAIWLPPAHWLASVGVCLIFVAVLARSARTNQWFTWQNEGPSNWFEGWAGLTGAILTVVPLLLDALRDWLGK